MRQEVARAHKGWALDQVTIFNEMTKLMPEECIKPPKVSFLKESLFQFLPPIPSTFPIIL